MTDISDDFIPECISLPGGNNLAEAQQLRQDTDANNNCPISDDILLDEPDDGSHGHLNGGHDAGPGKLSLASNNLGSCTGRDAGDGADASHGQPPRRSRRRSKERSESTETRRGSPGHTRHDVHPGSVSSTDAKPKKKLQKIHEMEEDEAETDTDKPRGRPWRVYVGRNDRRLSHYNIQQLNRKR